jgi:nitrogen fixation protein NifU and related proteins
MQLSDDLYRETILDHYHNPRNHGTIEHASCTVEGVNPLCGDELTLYLKIDSGKIADIKLNAKGCSINTASGSMMSEVVQGQPLEEVAKRIESFKHMMLESKDADVDLPESMEELEALQGVKKYPVRIKCALLPWNTLQEGLKAAQAPDGNGKAKLEVT